MFTLPLPNIYESVERPLIKKVIDDLLDHDFLLPFDRLDWSTTIEKSDNSTSKKTPITETHQAAYLPDERRLVVQENTAINPTKGSWLTARNPFRRQIFRDANSKANLVIIHDDIEMALEFTMHTPSLSEIQNYQRNLQTIVTRGKNHLLHDVSYNYALPTKTYEWIKEIHRLSVGEEIPIGEYFKASSINELTVRQAGQYREIIYQENQTEVEGNIGDTYISAIRKLQNGTYSITFRYTLFLELPTSVYADYPLLIKQQLIDPKFIPEPIQKPINAISMDGLLRAFTTYEPHAPFREVNRIPEFDTAPIKASFPNYSHLLIILVMITDQDTVLLNLHDLVDAEIDIRVLNLLRTAFTQNITDPYQSPLVISLHKDGYLMTSDYLTCDENLNIILTKPVDLNSVYHIVINLTSDVSTLPPNVIRKIRNNPEAIPPLVDGINAIVRGNSIQPLNRTLIPDDFSDEYFIYNCLPLIDTRTTDVNNPTGNYTTYSPKHQSPDNEFNVYPQEHKIFRGRSSGYLVSTKTVLTYHIKAEKKK